MIQSVYLHKYVVDTLCLFGDLSEVVNRILQEGADGNIELIDRPPCKNREGAGRYNITINQPDYIDMLQYYPVNSPKLSIRRILYWFVDFAVYDDLGWKTVNRYEDKELKRLIKHIDTARSSLKRVGIAKKGDKKVERELIVIDELLNKLEEYLSNDGEHN